ncbi:hypothetical protein NESM_000832800 [Novymonas esmeraldas]|uniref:Uncharacterized protein n=1 Tax=Novymonas esmeraldas TaxID=1808958 RepID=A0AAW0EXW6_9TRYP
MRISAARRVPAAAAAAGAAVRGRGCSGVRRWQPAGAVVAIPRRTDCAACQRHASTTSAGRRRREAAWRPFTEASRQLRRALERRARPSAVTPASAVTTGVDGDEEETDAALAALAPPIVRITGTAASSVALMQQLGVLERADAHTAAGTPSAQARPSATATTTSNAAATDDDESLTFATASLLRVCQAGVQAQVASAVILRHMWEPSSGSAATMEGPRRPMSPTMQWAARLPASVRALLLSHDLERVQRRRDFANRGVQGEAAAAVAAAAAAADPASIAAGGEAPALAPVDRLSDMWEATVRESRAVVLCCCAPWLLQRASSAASADADAELLRLLYAPPERQVLEAGVALCALNHSEDVAHTLMEVFLRGVDVHSASAPTTPDAAAFELWYATEADGLYEAAMTAAAATRTHASAAVALLGDGAARRGFETAYAYLAHRGSALARRSATEPAAPPSEASASSSSSNSSSSNSSNSDNSSSGGGSGGWTSALAAQPRRAMRLVRALAGGVEGNADHFAVALHLFLRLVEETDVAVDADSVDDTRRALCAVLDALARVPLSATACVRSLENIYRRALLHSASEVTEHPEVLASCLRVCGAAGLSGRAVALFNRVAEPASHAVAVEERNVAAVLLSTTEAAATLQRIVSYLHTKLPVTADVVHAAAARALLTSTDSLHSSSATVFALFDLLELRVAAQHHAIASTAASFAGRSFFLRALTLLAAVYEQRAVTAAEQRAVTAALDTPAAADVFHGWVSAAERHHISGPRCPRSWAASLPPVTVGVLQELALELRRAARRRGAPGSAPAVSALVDAVESVLRDAATALPASVRVIASLDEAADATVARLPASLQWQRLHDDWPVAQQRVFLAAARRLLLAEGSESSATAATVCLRYQDWAVLCALQSRCDGAVVALPGIVGAWTAAMAPLVRGGGSAAAAAASPSSSGVALSVLSPVAEVQWWISRDAGADGTTAAPSRVSDVCVSEYVDVPVPPVLGCPTHSWTGAPPPLTAATTTTTTAGAAHAGRVALVSYWLQRWVDSVEDVRPLPRHGVFRVHAARALTRCAAGAATADGDGVGAADVFSGIRRSGVADMFVRGPSPAGAAVHVVRRRS